VRTGLLKTIIFSTLALEQAQR